MQLFFQAVRGLGKESLPLAEGNIILLNQFLNVTLAEVNFNSTNLSFEFRVIFIFSYQNNLTAFLKACLGACRPKQKFCFILFGLE